MPYSPWIICNPKNVNTMLLRLMNSICQITALVCN